jgi:hypothetical protein
VLGEIEHVDGFWIDRTPVTNRQFKAFVKATGYVTTAQIVPDPKDYPGALPEMIFAGSLVFTPPPRVTDLKDWSQWWSFMKGADWRHPKHDAWLLHRGGDDARIGALLRGTLMEIAARAPRFQRGFHRRRGDRLLEEAQRSSASSALRLTSHPPKPTRIA